MKKQLIGMGVPLALLFGVETSQATLIDGSGGGLNWTSDTDTGLDWLDMSFSLNQSYNIVVDRLADPVDTLYGWRHASVSEVVTLWNHATGETWGGIQGYWSMYDGWTDAVAAHVGYGYDNGYTQYIYGLTSDFTSATSVAMGVLVDSQYQPGEDGAWTNQSIASTSSASYISSWLVRGTQTSDGPAPVPEPSTMLLFSLGLAGLAIARRRKN